MAEGAQGGGRRAAAGLARAAKGGDGAGADAVVVCALSLVFWCFGVVAARDRVLWDGDVYVHGRELPADPLGYRCG